MDTASLAGKKCVVTGATSGIGLSTAWALAPINGLVNCAGYYNARRVLSAEGLEMQFAVNHLAAFRLSLDLLPALSPDARIAVVSSSSHYYGWIRWSDPSLEGHYLGLWAYEQSKLADVLFAYELSRRLKRGQLVAGEKVPQRGLPTAPKQAPTVFAVDPGLVNTAMGQKHGKSLSSLFWDIHRRRGTSPDVPADGIARLLSSPKAAGMTGQYWRDAKPLRSSRLSYDEEAAYRLWSLSEEMIARVLART